MSNVFCQFGIAMSAVLVISTNGYAQQEAPSPPKKKKAKIDVSGRVFVGDTAVRQRVGNDVFWRNEQAIHSARLGVRYIHPEGFRAVIKVEFADDVELKDAVLQFQRGGPLAVTAGRFKRPMSSIALASRWDLPVVERGLLSRLDVQGQDLVFAGGRVDGVMVEYSPAISSVTPTFTLAMVQNDLGAGAVSLDAADHFAQDVYLRASIEPTEGLELASSVAVFGYLKEVGNGDSFSHAPILSLEAAYRSKRLRAWAEGFVGESMYSDTGRFWAARTIIAPRFRPSFARRVSPFVGASYFDPRIGVGENSSSEVQGGVMIGFSKVWRLQFQIEQTFSMGTASPVLDNTAFRIQLATKFKD